ncbi:MAG: gamma-glutamylcyclotransferase [Saccharospirillum sp.]
MTLEHMRAFLKTQSLTDMAPVIEEILRAKPEPGPVWVFGYGSLIWNPEMAFLDDQAATLPGHRRDFCLSSIVYRGTPDRPGVVLGVRASDSHHCVGHAFMLDPAQQYESLEHLLFRELVSDCYLPLWLPVHLQSGHTVRALTMVVNQAHPRYLELPDEALLDRILGAVGPRGSNYDYLINLVRHFEVSGIEDEHLSQLYRSAKQRLER